MFKRCFALMLALCLLLTTSSVAYMEGDNDIVFPEAMEAAEYIAEEASIDEETDVDLPYIDSEAPEADDASAIDAPVDTKDNAVEENTEAADSAVDGEEVTAVAPAAEGETVEAIAEEASDNNEAEAPVAVEETPAVAEEAPVVVEEAPVAAAKTIAAEAALAEAAPAELVLTGSTKYTMSVGEALQLNLNGLTAKSFKSSKKKIASVSGTGLITAKKKGKTKITVTITKKKKFTLTLTVVDPTIPTKVYLTQNGAVVSGTITVNKNEIITLVPVAEAAGTPNTGFKWKSSKKKVASVSNGVIKGKKTGTTTVTVTTTRGKKKAKIKVKVVDPYKATSVSLNETGLIYVFKKGTLQLKATMQPENSTSTLKWSSSNKKVATVSKNGLVKAKKKGKAVITVKTSSGKKARVTVKVIAKGGNAKSLMPEWSPDEANHFVYRGAVDTYVVSTDPLSSNANVVWTSDNPNVLSVVEYARSGDLRFWCDVQGVNNGSAVLTATDTVTGLSQSVRITVMEPPAPESISFPAGNVTMSLGENRDIKYDVNPTTSYNSNYNRAVVTFDPNIVNITYDSNNADRNCLGTMDYYLHTSAVGRGTTTVTVTLRNGVTASFTLTVV